jgi:hypothetical protein
MVRIICIEKIGMMLRIWILDFGIGPPPLLVVLLLPLLLVLALVLSLVLVLVHNCRLCICYFPPSTRFASVLVLV